MSNLPGPVLSDWLMDSGLEPPSPAAAPFDGVAGVVGRRRS